MAKVLNKKVEDTVDITQRGVESFLNNEVKDYAKYVIETRAMPNIMDGLRVGARKIIWASMTGDLSRKVKVKMPSLIGDVFKLHYNHGDASLMNTIVQLSSTHVLEYCPLEVVGQIGTLRVPKCDTAPRYLTIKKSKHIDIFSMDKELFTIKTEEGDEVEPKYYLPIIPIALLWRTSSPGFGFSYKATSYDINTIIDNCIKSIVEGSCIGINEFPLMPKIEGIEPENMIFNDNKNSWYNIGNYSTDFEKDTCYINELPYNVSLEQYEEHLEDLVEKNYIVKYVDLGMNGNIKYMIKFAHGRLQLLYNEKWKFYKAMKLYTKIPKDILNVLDADGKKILFFDSPYELIDAFIKRRLVYYDKRKHQTIRVITALINTLKNRIKFINLIVNNELVINKRSSKDIKVDLDFHKIPYDVLKLNIDKLTQDEIDKMNETIKEREEYLEYIKHTSIKEMYVNDLADFKQNYLTINHKQI